MTKTHRGGGDTHTSHGLQAALTLNLETTVTLLSPLVVGCSVSLSVKIWCSRWLSDFWSRPMSSGGTGSCNRGAGWRWFNGAVVKSTNTIQKLFSSHTPCFSPPCPVSGSWLCQRNGSRWSVAPCWTCPSWCWGCHTAPSPNGPWTSLRRRLD